MFISLDFNNCLHNFLISQAVEVSKDFDFFLNGSIKC